MDSSPFSARRATAEDLPFLQTLWQEAGLPWEQLGGFINEFQVATDDNGLIVGAIGLLLEEDQGLLHTEAVAPGADADSVRAALWRRVQIVARHQGVQRLWTQEDAEYWSASGFAAVAPPLVERTRATFLDPTANWLAFDLMDPERAKGMINEQLAILEAERLRAAEHFQDRVKIFRTVAILMAAAVLGVCLWLLLRILKSPDLMKRLLGH